MIIKNFFCFTVFVFAWVIPSYASVDVSYSGFAFSGNASEISSSFKYSNLLKTYSLDENRRSIFDKQFYDYFVQNQDVLDKSINLKIAKNNNESIALAVVLTKENVSVEAVGAVYKIVFNLCVNVFILDFDTKVILRSYPLFIEYIDASKQEPTEDYLVEKISDLYFSEDFSLLSILKERLPDIAIGNNAESRTVRIKNIVIEEEAEKFTNNPESFKGIVAQRFGDVLSDKLKIAMLPFARDALNSKMTLVFSDASVQDFKIPEGSYSVDLIIRKYVKQDHKLTVSEKSYVYGVYTTVKVYDNSLGIDYWEEKIKHGEVKVVPITQEKINDFTVFDEITGIVMVKIADEMKKDKKFYKEVIKRCVEN